VPLTLIAGGRLKLPTEGRKVEPSAQVMYSMLIGLALAPGAKQLPGVCLTKRHALLYHLDID